MVGVVLDRYSLSEVCSHVIAINENDCYLNSVGPMTWFCSVAIQNLTDPLVGSLCFFVESKGSFGCCPSPTDFSTWQRTNIICDVFEFLRGTKKIRSRSVTDSSIRTGLTHLWSHTRTNQQHISDSPNVRVLGANDAIGGQLSSGALHASATSFARTP